MNLEEGIVNIKDFKESNVVIAEDQPEYQNLPSHRTSDNDGMVTSCWSLSLKEMLKILWTGCIWVQMLTFNTSLQPLKVLVDKPDFEELGKRGRPPKRTTPPGPQNPPRPPNHRPVGAGWVN